jgi:hypothetical protein
MDKLNLLDKILFGIISIIGIINALIGPLVIIALITYMTTW